ncbi:hypothetical protein DL766_004738 [Monosporascus sp. MC13-8B]|uniref:AA1-like domain-containing protein n=1 Tax=Monosporascus cannonballus TaxID=155416 RepID=A0ABY0H2J0_9PEZI|nr:hypothetical protein DL762_006655 [Monosporascus cannonballus]RYO88470.1 hypothetical protein DL763_005969 [Monosporascus cannonballus]RYP30726.1 hypothetical protein DL766_004738 [Monosporascus sp. MC13-8B]
MRFTIATAAALFLGATAYAQPQRGGSPPDPNSYENIDISDLYVWKDQTGKVTSAYFGLTGKDATNLSCEVQNPEKLPTDVITCGDSMYRFALDKGDSDEFALRIYHELGSGAGFYGRGDVFTYCHSGGQNRIICAQQNPTTIVIDNGPQ